MVDKPNGGQPGDKLPGKPRTTNEKIIDEVLTHSHYLERLSESNVRKVRSFLADDVLPDLMGRLTSRLESIQSRGFDVGITRTQRMQKLINGFNEILDDGLTAAKKMHVEGLVELSKYEGKWVTSALQRSVPAEVGVEFVKPSAALLKQLVTDRPINGFNVGKWWDSLQIDAAKRIEQQARVGLASGETVPDIARRIRGTVELNGTDGVFEVTQRHAETLVRSADVSIADAARLETYKENDDVVKGESWVSTLDLRTCPVCGALDGRRFDVGDGPRPVDSTHPNCRCARVPIVKSLNEILRDSGSKKRVRDFGASTRASMDGEVPDSVTYEDWLGSRSVEEIQTALGKSRAAAFLHGDLPLNRMVDQSGRALTLEQIALREKIEI